MITEQIQITDILSAIFQRCDTKETGTFFISTNNNKSCQIALKNGIIESISLGAIKGSKALTLLKNTQKGRFYFKKNFMLPTLGNAKITSSEEALQYLGYKHQESTTTHEDLPSKTINKPIIIYRGQVVS